MNPNRRLTALLNSQNSGIASFSRGVLRRIALILFFSGASFVPAVHAQVSASITGTVTDPSGAPVPSAGVQTKNLETGAIRNSATDDAGRYLVLSLPVGEYEVRITKSGFRDAIRSGIHLVVGEEASVDLRLQVGEVKSEVTVTDDAPMVSTSTADISGLVGEQAVKDLPLNGRSYDLLLTLNPGIVNFTSQKTGGTGISNSTTANNFSVSGNRPQQNIFLLNGVEYTGAAENNMQPGGASGMLLGVDAVREFNVLRDSYSAEFGKRPGGQVILVTQSGTQPVARLRVRIFAQQRSGRAEFLRSRLRAAVSTQPVWSVARRAGPERQDIYFRQLRRFPPESAADFRGVCSRCRFARRRSSQRSAAAEFVADRPRRMLPTSAESPNSSAARCKPSAKILERCASTTLFP